MKSSCIFAVSENPVKMFLYRITLKPGRMERLFR